MEDDKTNKAESVGKFLDSFTQSNAKKNNDFKIEKINRVHAAPKTSGSPDLEVTDDSYEFLNEKEELNILDFEEKKEEPVSQKDTLTERAEPVKAREPVSVKELKPEIRQAVSKILETVPKEEVKKLLEEMKSDRDALLNKRPEALGDLNEKDKTMLMDKLDEWEVNRELSEVNASVIISWLNKTIAN